MPYGYGYGGCGYGGGGGYGSTFRINRCAFHSFNNRWS